MAQIPFGPNAASTLMPPSGGAADHEVQEALA